MSDPVVVDFHLESEFPKKPGGERPKVEVVREQVQSFIDGYVAAKRRLPSRIVLAAQDHRHCVRRILARMQRPHRQKAKAEWQERRKAGSKELWRDCKPQPIKVAHLHWGGIPIEQVGFSRHRPVDRAAA